MPASTLSEARDIAGRAAHALDQLVRMLLDSVPDSPARDGLLRELTREIDRLRSI